MCCQICGVKPDLIAPHLTVNASAPSVRFEIEREPGFVFGIRRPSKDPQAAEDELQDQGRMAGGPHYGNRIYVPRAARNMRIEREV